MVGRDVGEMLGDAQWMDLGYPLGVSAWGTHLVYPLGVSTLLGAVVGDEGPGPGLGLKSRDELPRESSHERTNHATPSTINLRIALLLQDTPFTPIYVLYSMQPANSAPSCPLGPSPSPYQIEIRQQELCDLATTKKHGCSIASGVGVRNLAKRDPMPNFRVHGELQ